ncbi:MAG: MBL fold metallo-hydrolase [Bryobacteraceae bacterium]
MTGLRFELSDILQVELPLPFAFGSVNAYLVRLTDGFLLVDCGMDTDPCREAWEAFLRRQRIRWRDIRTVVVTHMHPDHCGLAPKIIEWSGASLWMHAEESQLLDEVTLSDKRQEWVQTTLEMAGSPPEMRGKVKASFAALKRALQPLKPDVLLWGGEALTAASGVVEILSTRGHSRGHLMLYHRSSRCLIAGDQMLEYTTPNIPWEADHDALREYLRSLDHIARYEIDRILPGHGAAFQGQHAWIEAARRHHMGRCDRILDLLGHGAASAHSLVARLWPRSLAPLDYRFAAFEVLAHLAYLEGNGQVQRENGASPVLWRLACENRVAAPKMRVSRILSPPEKDAS